MNWAETGPSAANSASSTSRRGAEIRCPLSRRTARTSSIRSNSSAEDLRGFGQERNSSDHFCSMCPKCQTARATSQVSAKAGGDRVADVIEVEPGDEVPRLPGQAQPGAQHRDQLDRPDQQCHEHRKGGDGDVVEELSHRLREGPAVGEVHEHAVERVEQGHPGGEEDRQAEDRVDRQAPRGGGAGRRQQRDLGRGVEAEAEQKAERIHLPGGGDGVGGPRERRLMKPRRPSWRFELGLAVLAGPQAQEDPDDADQDDQVQEPDREQEEAGDGRPDQAARRNEARSRRR